MADSRSPPWKVKAAAGFAVCIVGFVMIEALSRVAYAYREEMKSLPGVSHLLTRSLILNSYEMPDPGGGYHWVLKPGYVSSLAELRRAKQLHGKHLSARLMTENPGPKARTGPANLHINKDGFRGPEIDRAHSRPRILTVGDSVTFGSGLYTYPRAIEKALSAVAGGVEVINAGVEGYSATNVIHELGRYKALKPDIVTIYIGWNSIFSDAPFDFGVSRYLRCVWLARRAWSVVGRIFTDPREYATGLYNRDLKPDRNDPLIRELENYVPQSIAKVARIVDEMGKTGSQVVLITLPGLFIMNEDPSPRALRIGHLPAFTKNPYVIAKLTERYNDALWSLARSRNLPVIDLARWSVTAFQPRTDYFVDSVHIKPKTLEQVGQYLAKQLSSMIKSPR